MADGYLSRRQFVAGGAAVALAGMFGVMTGCTAGGSGAAAGAADPQSGNGGGAHDGERRDRNRACGHRPDARQRAASCRGHDAQHAPRLGLDAPPSPGYLGTVCVAVGTRHGQQALDALRGRPEETPPGAARGCERAP